MRHIQDGLCPTDMVYLPGLNSLNARTTVRFADQSYNCLGSSRPVIVVRDLATVPKLVSALCCALLLGAPARADNDGSTESQPGNPILKPLTIDDDKYWQSNIPAKNQQGVLTLNAAIQEAAVKNKDVLEAGLQVSRFKWDYIGQRNRQIA